MPDEQIIRAFLEKATAEGAKSTALKPLNYILALLIPATLLSFYANLPSWVGVTFIAFLGLVLVAYLGAYIYFMLTDKDSLRSEKFTIQKFAIEKGLYGDSLVGSVDPEDLTDTKMLTLENGNDQEASQ